MHRIYKFCIININICELNKHIISVDIDWDKLRQTYLSIIFEFSKIDFSN